MRKSVKGDPSFLIGDGKDLNQKTLSYKLTPFSSFAVFIAMVILNFQTKNKMCLCTNQSVIHRPEIPNAFRLKFYNTRKVSHHSNGPSSQSLLDLVFIL